LQVGASLIFGEPQPVERAQARPRVAPLPRDKFLAQCRVLEEKTLTRTKEANQSSEVELEESKHGQELYQNGHETTAPMLLISSSARVLANDSLNFGLQLVDL
jgi:hypothetical protein